MIDQVSILIIKQNISVFFYSICRVVIVMISLIVSSSCNLFLVLRRLESTFVMVYSSTCYFFLVEPSVLKDSKQKITVLCRAARYIACDSHE